MLEPMDPCGKLVLEEGVSLALVLLPSLTMGSSQSRTCIKVSR